MRMGVVLLTFSYTPIKTDTFGSDAAVQMPLSYFPGHVPRDQTTSKKQIEQLHLRSANKNANVSTDEGQADRPVPPFMYALVQSIGSIQTPKSEYLIDPGITCR